MLAKLKILFTISLIASIMIIGGVIASPDAYSDKKHDDVPDECQCEKPDTLKFIFTAPTPLPVGDVIFQAEIFKNLDEKNNEEKQLGDEIILTPNDSLSPSMVQAADWGKDKLESNTAFVIYKVVTLGDEITKEIVAEMEIHTSCSKPLFIGKTVFDADDPNNGYSLEVTDGLKDGNRSIPGFEPNSCEAEKKKSTGTITVRKALTNDSGGDADFKDFKITVTNVETPDVSIDLVPLELEPGILDYSINVKDVPAGTYTLSKILLDPSKGVYTTVLIAGDTGCPSMVDEVFTIKKNKNLSCTIYNDDDGSSGGSGGIVFQNNSLQILIDALPQNDLDGDGIVNYLDVDWGGALDSCVTDIVLDENLNEVPVRKSTPCIEIINEQEIAILDDELEDNTNTIILFSVVENEWDDSAFDNPNGGSANAGCILETLVPYSEYAHPDPDDTNLAVKFGCNGINTDEYVNINYVMINPLLSP